MIEEEDNDEEYIKVTVNVHGVSFTIPCGEGEQDVKWLALVAAKRYAHREVRLSQQTHGRVRPQLDRFNTIVYRPQNVYMSGSSQIVSSATKIKDIFPSGGELDLELHKEIEIDAEGAPVLTPWEAEAFIFSDQGKIRFAASQKALREKEEEKEAERDAQTSLDRYAHQVLSAEFTATGLSATFDTATEIIADVEAQWSDIKTEDIFNDADDKLAIKNVILRNYRLINAVFYHFGASTGRQESYAMSYSEYLHFIHYFTNMSLRHEAELIEEIFRQSNVQKYVSYSISLYVTFIYIFFFSLLSLILILHL